MQPDKASPASSITSLTGRIRRAAIDLGFDVIGFAPAGPIDHSASFIRWLDEGRQGEMEWLGRDPERRVDPRKLDPRIRSVVSVGMSYRGNEATPPAYSVPTGRIAAQAAPGYSAPTGRIARYARGADYHNILGRRLRKLLRQLRESEPGLDGRWYVDTGPVMDRAWAARSGVGWWGKHTNLVSRKHGSWLLLGTLLLNSELEYDEPERDFCGTCRRCIDVCPTRAITAERELDARLCISYLTIEHRGPIPRGLRPAIGDWIFGCDLCLEVCPWNRFAEMSREGRLAWTLELPDAGPSSESRFRLRDADAPHDCSNDSPFRPREDRDAPVLIPLLDITDEAFRRKFNGSPIQRARRDGFVRNVAIALGNVGGPDSIEPLIRVLTHDESSLVRGHAAWALGQIAARLGVVDQAAAEAARAALAHASDSDPFVLEEIEAARRAIFPLS